jgi:hypothetical protein
MSPAGQTPLVSVLMPAYNHERYVGAALDSVTAQAYRHWELVVVDDGSTDATADIVERRSTDDPRVRLLRRPHTGPEGLGEAYRAGLDECRGELIALLEADDTWPAGKLERQVPDFAEPEVVLSFGDYDWIDSGGGTIRRVSLSEALPPEALSNDPPGVAAWHMAGLAHRTFTFPCTVVIRNAALKAAGGFHELAGPISLVDFPTFLELALLGRFTYHPEVLGGWRRHLRSLTLANDEAITRAARDHARAFLAAHPELRPPDASERTISRAWEAAIAGALFTEARVALVTGDWGGASARLRRLVRGSAPARLQALAGLGLAASAAHRDLEPLLRVALGYDLRALAV